LLSNGAEDNKGSPVSKEAFKMLKESNFAGFKGNIYIWFDLQKYKDEISERLKEQELNQINYVNNPVTEQVINAPSDDTD
jgi:hypothetical protein